MSRSLIDLRRRHSSSSTLKSSTATRKVKSANAIGRFRPPSRANAAATRLIETEKHPAPKYSRKFHRQTRPQQFRSSILDLEIDLIEKLDQIDKKASVVDKEMLQLNCYRDLLDQLITQDTSCGHLLAKIRAEFDRFLPSRAVEVPGNQDGDPVNLGMNQLEIRPHQNDIPALDLNRVAVYSDPSDDEESLDKYFMD